MALEGVSEIVEGAWKCRFLAYLEYKEAAKRSEMNFHEFAAGILTYQFEHPPHFS